MLKQSRLFRVLVDRKLISKSEWRSDLRKAGLTTGGIGLGATLLELQWHGTIVLLLSAVILWFGHSEMQSGEGE